MHIAISWVLLFGIYLLFAGSLEGPECAGAAIFASVATGLVGFVAVEGRLPIRIRAPWPTLAWRLLKSVGTDSALVCIALLRAISGNAVRGLLEKQPFAAGQDAIPEPEILGRRGVVILLASVAPNGFVLDLDLDRQALLLHRLVAAPRSQDLSWPV